MILNSHHFSFPFFAIRPVRKKQQSHVHLNLCLALICFYLTFLIGIDRTSNPIVCRIIASTIHYFCLSSVAWTSVEAFTLYKYIWEMRRSEVNYLIRFALVFGWGEHDLMFFRVYMKRRFLILCSCFLQTGFGLYFGFLLEVVLLILFNCVFYVFVTYRVTCRKVMAKNIGAKKRELITRVKSVIFFWLLLGLSWIFGFFATINSPIKIVFDILFSVFMALQGVGMFYMLVVQNNEMKKSLGRFSTHVLSSVSLPNTSKYSLSSSGDKRSIFSSSVSTKDSISMSGIQLKEKYTQTET
ncbi:Adhesion G protein-coupled receptor L3 [Holothuria leucospilota]|uniref:Adhesion G protein-coupled receptor L3 n=1 Tax=Holothuria leucospilota TaxID=206669 RepID=A0A9Q1CEX9_HOLLE|nr:Adhesion G protein-coupled receptor L3 [Holothuria leucospilota]